MAQDSPEAVITPEDLKISAADARQGYPDQNFSRFRLGAGQLFEDHLPVFTAI
jgi:hypothetical protein